MDLQVPTTLSLVFWFYLVIITKHELNATFILGPIGQLIAGDIENYEVDRHYHRIDIGESLVELPDSVVKDLNTDQKYGYKMVKMIQTGTVDPDLMELAVGPISHSRWLTTANRILRLYVSKHGLRGKNRKHLRQLAQFIVVVYYPMWFSIKCSPLLIDGPRHVVKQVQLIQQFCDKEVKDIVSRYVESSAWQAHSELIILACLTSDDEVERHFGVRKLEELRAGSDVGDNSVRDFHVPKINWETKNITDLINWDEVLEPSVTCKMTREEIVQCLDKKLEIPHYPCHGQSIERCVKQVTIAASQVYGEDARDGYIRAGVKSRELFPVEASKKDMVNMIKPK